MSGEITTISQEKENLSLHVDLCAQRYLLLEKRLEILEVKFDALSEKIAKSSNSLKTTIVTSTGTIIVGILGLITTMAIK